MNVVGWHEVQLHVVRVLSANGVRCAQFSRIGGFHRLSDALLALGEWHEDEIAQRISAKEWHADFVGALEPLCDSLDAARLLLSIVLEGVFNDNFRQTPRNTAARASLRAHSALQHALLTLLMHCAAVHPDAVAMMRHVQVWELLAGPYFWSHPRAHEPYHLANASKHPNDRQPSQPHHDSLGKAILRFAAVALSLDDSALGSSFLIDALGVAVREENAALQVALSETLVVRSCKAVLPTAVALLPRVHTSALSNLLAFITSCLQSAADVDAAIDQTEIVECVLQLMRKRSGGTADLLSRCILLNSNVVVHRFLDTLVAMDPLNEPDMITEMLAFIESVVNAQAGIQRVFVEHHAFIKIVHLLVPRGGIQVLHSVVRVIIALLRGNDNAKAHFAETIGYDQFQARLLQCYDHRPDASLLVLLFDMVFDGMHPNPIRSADQLHPSNGQFGPNSNGQSNSLIVASHNVESEAPATIENADAVVLLVGMLPVLPNELQSLVLSTLAALLRDSTPNKSVCCKSNLLHMLLGEMLRPENPHLEQLMQLVELLGAHSITIRELKKIFALLRIEDGQRPALWPRLLQALHVMTVGQGDGPQIFFDLLGASALALPVLVRPFSRGFGFFAWLRLEGPQRPRARLFSFLHSEDDEICGFECVVERGAFELLLYRKRERERVRLNTELRLESNRWYSVAITQHAGRFAASADVRLFLNGHLEATGRARFALPLEFNASCIGNNVSVAGDAELASSHGLRGQLGSIYVFEDAVSSEQVTRVHVLGPDYVGNLEEADTEGSLSASLLLCYSAKALRGDICLDNTPHHQHGAANPFNARLHRLVYCMTHDIRRVIHYLGGTRALFPLLLQLNLPIRGLPALHVDAAVVQMLQVLQLLADLLQSQTNQEELLRCNGPSQLAFVLQRVDARYFAMPTLTAMHDLASTITLAPLRDEFYRCVFLDFRLWLYTPYHVQKRLLRLLAQKIRNEVPFLHELFPVTRIIEVLCMVYWYTNVPRRPQLASSSSSIISEPHTPTEMLSSLYEAEEGKISPVPFLLDDAPLEIISEEQEILEPHKKGTDRSWLRKSFEPVRDSKLDENIRLRVRMPPGGAALNHKQLRKLRSIFFDMIGEYCTLHPANVKTYMREVLAYASVCEADAVSDALMFIAREPISAELGGIVAGHLLPFVAEGVAVAPAALAAIAALLDLEYPRQKLSKKTKFNPFFHHLLELLRSIDIDEHVAQCAVRCCILREQPDQLVRPEGIIMLLGIMPQLTIDVAMRVLHNLTSLLALPSNRDRMLLIADWVHWLVDALYSHDDAAYESALIEIFSSCVASSLRDQRGYKHLNEWYAELAQRERTWSAKAVRCTRRILMSVVQQLPEVQLAARRDALMLVVLIDHVEDFMFYSPVGAAIAGAAGMHYMLPQRDSETIGAREIAANEVSEVSEASDGAVWLDLELALETLDLIENYELRKAQTSRDGGVQRMELRLCLAVIAETVQRKEGMWAVYLSNTISRVNQLAPSFDMQECQFVLLHLLRALRVLNLHAAREAIAMAIDKIVLLCRRLLKRLHDTLLVMLSKAHANASNYLATLISAPAPSLVWFVFSETLGFVMIQYLESIELTARAREQGLLAAVQQRTRWEITLVKRTREAISIALPLVRPRLSTAVMRAQEQYAEAMRDWRRMMKSLTAEGCVWADAQPAQHWKLDSTENFSRMRLKLKRNKTFNDHAGAAHRARSQSLPLASQNARPALPVLPPAAVRDLLPDAEPNDLQAQIEQTAQTAQTEQTEQTAQGDEARLRLYCSLITPMKECKGELIISRTRLLFCELSSPDVIGESRTKHAAWSMADVREVHMRRYLLRPTALEIFSVLQTNYLFNFASTSERNRVHKCIVGAKPPNLAYSESSAPREVFATSGLMLAWQARAISNFYYLMQLNTMAGRTYNDLTQYPVFPWVIADYESETLDLSDPASFRDLSKPIGSLMQGRAAAAAARYESLQDGPVPPFHHGSHYSSPGTVLHYLVRMEPFTTHFLKLQDGHFDFADRMFHSVPLAWHNCLRNTSDVKELIPEFYYQPEFLLNSNNFQLGTRQNGVTLGDVQLPRWAANAHDMVRIFREALESDYVSEHLHEWVDLVFGNKQRGRNAVSALNMFYHLTYEGAVDLDAIEDKVQRRAIEAQILNFGQTPSQLLTTPHPPRGPHAAVQLLEAVNHQTVFSIKLTPHPIIFIERSNDALIAAAAGTHLGQYDRITTIDASSTAAFHRWMPNVESRDDTPFTLERDVVQRRPVGIPLHPQMRIAPSLFAITLDNKVIISAGHWDNSFRLSIAENSRLLQSVVQHKDVVTCLALAARDRMLVTASRDTTLMVWSIRESNGFYRCATAPTHILYGHDDEVICVAVSIQLDVVLSGAANGMLRIHTLRHGKYVRSIAHGAAPSLFAIASNGYIVVYSSTALELALYSINGELLLTCNTPRVNHMIITVDSRYLITGGDSIIVRTLHNLKFSYKHQIGHQVRSLTFTQNESHLLVGLDNGSMLIVYRSEAQLK